MNQSQQAAAPSNEVVQQMVRALLLDRAPTESWEDAMRRLYAIAAAAALASSPQPAEPIMWLNGYQLRDALDFIAPDGTDEQLECEVCIQHGPERTTDEGTDAAGMFCWDGEYPEEGSVRLGEGPEDCLASPPSAPAEVPKPDAGHQLLQALIDSIEIVDGRACWDYMAMYEVRDALTALASAASAQNSGWTSVQERMPPLGVEVLTLRATDRLGRFMLDTWDEQHESPVPWSSATIPVGQGWDSGADFEEVTHWMEIPPPVSAPTVGKENGDD